MSIFRDKYAEFAFLKPEDIMTVMQWSKANTYRYLNKVMEDGTPFVVVKMAGTIRVEKDSFLNYLSAICVLTA